MKNKKAILIGDNEKMKYHPLSGPDRELSDILDEFELEIAEDYDRFREESLKAFDLCISFTDCWDDKPGDEQVVGLLSYVAHGGGLLSIHNGISLCGRYELAQLHGGKFTGHPEQKVLTYTPDFQVM
jgi:type 1 glutamine amidotransferase